MRWKQETVLLLAKSLSPFSLTKLFREVSSSDRNKLNLATRTRPRQVETFCSKVLFDASSLIFFLLVFLPTKKDDSNCLNLNNAFTGRLTDLLVVWFGLK